MILITIHEYMVEGLMPLNELHIVAGESGAGKSTWLLQMIDDWQNERPVLGRKSTWYPYVIFVQDRTKAGVFRTLERMKLNPKAFPVQSALEGGDLSLADKIKDFKKKNPDVRIIFVEGLHVGLEDSNDYGKTSSAIRELIALCRNEKLTIVATTHTCGHWNEPALRQANILCVTAADRHGCNRLAQFETGNAFADLIHNADQVPTGGIGHARRFGWTPSRASTSGELTPAASTFTRTSPGISQVHHTSVTGYAVALT